MSLDKMTPEELEYAIGDKIKEMFEKDPAHLFSFFLNVALKMLVETNAADLKVSHESTFEGKRYKTTVIAKTKKIKNIH